MLIEIATPAPPRRRYRPRKINEPREIQRGTGQKIIRGHVKLITDLLAQTPLCKSKGEARRTLEQGGAYLNNLPVKDVARTVTLADLATPCALVLRKGKKSYCVVRIEA